VSVTLVKFQWKPNFEFRQYMQKRATEAIVAAYLGKGMVP